MNEKLAKKLNKLLAKAGLEEDAIDGIISEVEEALAEEGANEDVNPEDVTLPPSENEGEPKGDVDLPPQENEDVPPTQQEPDVVPPAEGEVPPVDGDIASALNELANQEQEGVAPVDVPVDNVPPQAPAIDPQVQELVDRLTEANKTIDALVNRVDSLEQALQESGVISGTSKLGDETPRITPNANANQEDAFDDMLNVINGK